MSLAFVRGIHRWLLNSRHKWTAKRKMFPFDDVIIQVPYLQSISYNRIRKKSVESQFDGLVQDSSNPNALAMQLLQFCTNFAIEFM